MTYRVDILVGTLRGIGELAVQMGPASEGFCDPGVMILLTLMLTTALDNRGRS